jgi:hypothetical protein
MKWPLMKIPQKIQKHSKQNKTNCESADAGTDFTAGLADKLA